MIVVVGAGIAGLCAALAAAGDSRLGSPPADARRFRRMAHTDRRKCCWYARISSSNRTHTMLKAVWPLRFSMTIRLRCMRPTLWLPVMGCAIAPQSTF